MGQRRDQRLGKENLDKAGLEDTLTAKNLPVNLTPIPVLCREPARPTPGPARLSWLISSFQFLWAGGT